MSIKGMRLPGTFSALYSTLWIMVGLSFASVSSSLTVNLSSSISLKLVSSSSFDMSNSIEVLI